MIGWSDQLVSARCLSICSLTIKSDIVQHLHSFYIFVFASRRGQMNPIPQLISSVAMPSIKGGLSQVYCLFRRRWSRLVDYIYDHLRCHNPAYKPKDGAGQHINSDRSFFNSSAMLGFSEVRINYSHSAFLLLPRPDF